MRELTDTCLRNPIGHNGTIYDMNVLQELDFLVTQRRVHTLHHRNITFPPHHRHGPQSDTASQASEGFLEDENWWRAFIRDDFFEMDKDIVSTPGMEPNLTIPAPQPAEAPALTVATPREPPTLMEAEPLGNGSEVDEILKALPSCNTCRDRRIKCNRQIPACQECLRTSRACVIFDPLLEGDVTLRYDRCLCFFNDISGLY